MLQKLNNSRKCLLIFLNPQRVDMKYKAHDLIAKAHLLVCWNNSKMHFAIQLHPLCNVTHEHVSIGPYQWSYHQLHLLLNFIPHLLYFLMNYCYPQNHLDSAWHYLLNGDNYVEPNKLIYIGLLSQRCFSLVYEKYANAISIFQKHSL